MKTIGNMICPPHHWFIDSCDYGRCIYCKLERDFRALQRSKLKDQMDARREAVHLKKQRGRPRKEVMQNGGEVLL